jgi:succinate dehydrogenase/fumarate reductase flavoprotein subunit
MCLVQSHGRFMEDYDSRLDLAPRDIVARAIHEQMISRNDSHVLLDIRCLLVPHPAHCLHLARTALETGLRRCVSACLDCAPRGWPKCAFWHRCESAVV